MINLAYSTVGIFTGELMTVQMLGTQAIVTVATLATNE